jgi:uncharacterized RDD family membrane protein YckC
MRHNDAASGARRLAAFAIDYGIIAVYAGLVAGISFAARWMTGANAVLPTAFAQKLAGQVLAFCLFTLPVVLYFALCEASRRQATLGKAIMRLRLTTVDHQRVPLKRSLLRSAIKFAPWELAHTAVWHIPGQPFVSEPRILNWAGWALALLVAAGYVASVFVGSGQTPYDWASGTKVVAGR